MSIRGIEGSVRLEEYPGFSFDETPRLAQDILSSQSLEDQLRRVEGLIQIMVDREDSLINSEKPDAADAILWFLDYDQTPPSSGRNLIDFLRLRQFDHILQKKFMEVLVKILDLDEGFGCFKKMAIGYLKRMAVEKLVNFFCDSDTPSYFLDYIDQGLFDKILYNNDCPNDMKKIAFEGILNWEKLPWALSDDIETAYAYSKLLEITGEEFIDLKERLIEKLFEGGACYIEVFSKKVEDSSILEREEKMVLLRKFASHLEFEQYKRHCSLK